jgi:hypothetical protein
MVLERTEDRHELDGKSSREHCYILSLALLGASLLGPVGDFVADEISD